MPFKSEKQRKWMHANEPEMAKKWEKEEALKEDLTPLRKIYSDLDKKFSKYDHKKISDVNKVAKFLKRKLSTGSQLPAFIASFYNDYRGGEDISKNQKRFFKYTKKMLKKGEAITAAVPPNKTPDAFRKSTYKAIQVDDEDDSDELLGGIKDYRKKIAKLDKKESMAAPFRRRNSRGLGRVMKVGINESDLGLTYKKGKTVKVTHKKSGKELIIIDKPNVKREYEKIGYFAEGTVNESPMAPFSSSEAKQHINQDIKKMSKHLGKASQQSIKIMMDGVKGGKYTAMDISRGIKEGPAGRAHFGELGFLQQLWNKVRDGFRRYTKDRKLS